VRLISIEKKKNVILSNGVKVSCDDILAKENLIKYNAIFLPGGKGCANFNEDYSPKLVSFCKKFAHSKVKFIAICAATECFYNWGMLTKDIKVTCYPGIQNNKFEENYVKQNVVESKNFITASGPGVAAELAFSVVSSFISSDKAKQIKKEMLY
jgi:putative intracellular protease/amidase